MRIPRAHSRKIPTTLLLQSQIDATVVQSNLQSRALKYAHSRASYLQDYFDRQLRKPDLNRHLDLHGSQRLINILPSFLFSACIVTILSTPIHRGVISYLLFRYERPQRGNAQFLGAIRHSQTPPLYIFPNSSMTIKVQSFSQ